MSLPRKVVRGGERELGVEQHVGEQEETALAGTLHVAYGAMAGSLYAFVRSRLPSVSPGLLGAGYGFALWAIGYEGWIPAMRILPRTTETPPRKWVVPIGSHLIYGAATALAFERLEKRSTGFVRR